MLYVWCDLIIDSVVAQRMKEPEETVEATEAKTESVEMQGEEKTASMKVGISVMFSHSFSTRSLKVSNR